MFLNNNIDAVLSDIEGSGHFKDEAAKILASGFFDDWYVLDASDTEITLVSAWKDAVSNYKEFLFSPRYIMDAPETPLKVHFRIPDYEDLEKMKLHPDLIASMQPPECDKKIEFYQSLDEFDEINPPPEKPLCTNEFSIDRIFEEIRQDNRKKVERGEKVEKPLIVNFDYLTNVDSFWIDNSCEDYQYPPNLTEAELMQYPVCVPTPSKVFNVVRKTVIEVTRSSTAKAVYIAKLTP